MPRGKNMAMSSSLIYNIDRLDGGGYLQNFNTSISTVWTKLNFLINQVHYPALSKLIT